MHLFYCFVLTEVCFIKTKSTSNVTMHIGNKQMEDIIIVILLGVGNINE